jgi:hypothetical protein
VSRFSDAQLLPAVDHDHDLDLDLELVLDLDLDLDLDCDLDLNLGLDCGLRWSASELDNKLEELS